MLQENGSLLLDVRSLNHFHTGTHFHMSLTKVRHCSANCYNVQYLLETPTVLKVKGYCTQSKPTFNGNPSTRADGDVTQYPWRLNIQCLHENWWNITEAFIVVFSILGILMTLKWQRQGKLTTLFKSDTGGPLQTDQCHNCFKFQFMHFFFFSFFFLLHSLFKTSKNVHF